MNLQMAYEEIWRGKLKDQQPPAKQSIPRVNETAALIDEHFGRVNRCSGALLDVGTGSGAMLARAQAMGFTPFGVDFNGPLLKWLGEQGFEVTSCDLNVDPLPAIKVKNAPGVAKELKREFGLDAPEHGNGYRVVTSCDVIEHLIDPGHMLAEIHRVLEPGGHGYLATPCAGYWQRVKQLAEGRMFRTSGDNVLRDGGHLSYWAEHDMRDAVMAAGFREVGFRYTHRNPAPARWHFGEWSDFAYMICYAVK